MRKDPDALWALLMILIGLVSVLIVLFTADIALRLRP